MIDRDAKWFEMRDSIAGVCEDVVYIHEIADALTEAGYMIPRKPSWWCENCGYPFPADEGNPTGKHDHCSICRSVDFTATNPATPSPETESETT